MRESGARKAGKSGTRGGADVSWYEILMAAGILAGVAAFCWVVYGQKGGPTGCIGCGKCVADGVCILTGKKVPGMAKKEAEKP